MTALDRRALPLAAVVTGMVVLVFVRAVRSGLFAGIDASWWWLLGMATAAGLLGSVVIHKQKRGGMVSWLHPARWLAGAGLLGVAAYAGPAVVSAGLLLLALASALTPRTVPQTLAPPITHMAIGLAMMVAVVGWLLPFPVHFSWVYRALAVLVCVLRFRTLRDDVRLAWQGWCRLEQEAGTWLLLAVLATCMAGLGLWLPSLGYDDNTTHLILPYQLLRDGYAHFDVSGQVWALAPWCSNVLHAIAALLAGREARAAVGLLWLLAGVHGAWRLASALGAKPQIALAAAALFSSLPLTGYFTTTLQVDGASTALLLQFAALLVASGKHLPPALLTAALLALLAGLKVSNGVFVLPALGWLGWLVLQQRQWRWGLQMGGIAALLAGASYFYATWVTGSPLFPLFNATFQSPYFAPVNFIDQHWLTGVSWRSLWDLTFHTERFGEHFAGACGIALLALLPAWVLEMWRRPSARAVGLWFAASGLMLFLQIQYLRYVFPATAVLVVIGVMGLARVIPEKFFAPLLAALVLVNTALMPTTVWFMHDDVWAQLLRQGPAVRADIEKSRAPERVLLRNILAAQPAACILMTDKRSPFAAMAAGHAVTTKKIHDPRIGATAAWAEEDPSGKRWQQVLTVLGSSHVMTAASPAPALRLALLQRGFQVVDAAGAARVWALPVAADRRCSGQLESVRDEARRHFHVWGRE